MTDIVSMRDISTNFKNGVASMELINVKVVVSPDGKYITVTNNEGFKHIASAQPVQNGAHIMDETRVELNGSIVQQAPEGHLIITTPAETVIDGFLPEKEFEIGQLTENGIFFGTSKEKDGTTKAWFADLEDAQDEAGNQLSANFNERAAYRDKRNAQNHLGHNDWVVAPARSYNKKEKTVFDSLRELYNKRAKIGGFDKAQYASSSRIHTSGSDLIQALDFKTGHATAVAEADRVPFRLVRSIKI